MVDRGGGNRRRVLLPQALGADEFLRVTWHEERGVLVFSHWNGDRCVAATPVRVTDTGELTELLVTALVRGVGDQGAGWGPPRADELVARDVASRSA